MHALSAIGGQIGPPGGRSLPDLGRLRRINRTEAFVGGQPNYRATLMREIESIFEVKLFDDLAAIPLETSLQADCSAIALIEGESPPQVLSSKLGGIKLARPFVQFEVIS